ncbi:hypothetical protein BBF96_03250 [Anoxybacter fermentans]|uniref:DUF6575 domain-containing protein n=1 Tax=Anoxybacter fermentans TaxID=1323375 RepID=A0A3Q9HP39_9FIRM|nr:DUF6575 domain-containing protein [Anoxybacter fermentans]AZR72481.1 hypothetical protein BBF96_03250 [Anoxybacter fermentans]
MNENYICLDFIGKLKILEIYEYYDGPRLFSCESISGQKYLAVWIDFDEDSERWLYVPVSNHRLSSVKRGLISLYEAFNCPEDGWLWDVKTFFHDQSNIVTQITPNQLSKEDLPDEDAFLNIQDKTLPDLSEDPCVFATRTRRDVIDLSLTGDSVHLNEIDTGVLGAILLNLQTLIHSLAYKSGGIRGRIPKNIKEATILKTVAVFEGSFGVRLVSKHSANLFNKTPVSEPLEKLMNLLSAKGDREKLSSLMKSLSLKSKIKFRQLLKALKDGNTEIKTIWGSPDLKSNAVSLTIEDINKALEVFELDEKEMTEINSYQGKLVGINMNKYSFEFITVDEERIVGELSEDLYKNVFEVPMFAEVKIKEIYEFNYVTQEEKITSILLEVNEISNPNIKDS